MKIIALLYCALVGRAAKAFAPALVPCSQQELSTIQLQALEDDQGEYSPLQSRRKMFQVLGTAACVLVGAPLHSQATESTAEKTIWLTGKPPKIPGQKPKDKNDVRGTRRDPNFLRSISDCKGKCENSLDSDGYAKSKEECLSECQDICCTTYEQCTFAIVPRI